MVNLDYVKRIDLSGDIDKKTFGIYLFDVDGETYPMVDIPRFKSIGVLQGNEGEQDIHVAVSTFYTVTKRLISVSRDRAVISIEAIYKDFAAEWYSRQKKKASGTEQKARPRKPKKPSAEAGQTKADEDETPTAKVHDFSDKKQLLDAYTEGYLLKFNRRPSIRYQNEGKIARELVKLYPLEKLKTMLQWYFESEEEFITKAQYDMKTFKAILEKTRKVGTSQE